MPDPEALPPEQPEPGWIYWQPRIKNLDGIHCANLSEWVRQTFRSQELLDFHHPLPPRMKQSALGAPSWAQGTWANVSPLDNEWWEGDDYFDRHIMYWLISPLEYWIEQKFYRTL